MGVVSKERVTVFLGASLGSVFFEGSLMFEAGLEFVMVVEAAFSFVLALFPLSATTVDHCNLVCFKPVPSSLLCTRDQRSGGWLPSIGLLESLEWIR